MIAHIKHVSAKQNMFMGYILNVYDIDWVAAAESLQSCLTLCNHMDGSPPGSSVPGIVQARTLEWAAISFTSNKKNEN